MINQHNHNDDDDTENVNVNNISVPFLTIITLVGFVVMGTYQFFADRQAIKDELKKEFTMELREQKALLDEIKNVIIFMQDKQKYLLENVWTRKDHRIWCFENQQKDATLICMDHEGDLKQENKLYLKPDSPEVIIKE